MIISPEECSSFNDICNSLNDFKELFAFGGLLVQPQLMHVSNLTLGCNIAPWHEHATFEFSLLLAGRVEYEFHESGRSVVLLPGDAIVIPAAFRHHWNLQAQANVIFGFMFYLSERSEAPREELERLHRSIASHDFRIPGFRELQEIVSRILLTSRKDSGYLEEKLRTLLEEAVIELFGKLLPPKNSRKKSPPLPPSSGGVAQAVMLYIHDNMDSPVTPGEVSRQMKMSLNRLNIRLRRECGRSVGQLIRERKLDIACRLLTNTNRQVKDIASAVGFRDVAYFCHCFKRNQGVSPAGYRNVNRPVS